MLLNVRYFCKKRSEICLCGRSPPTNTSSSAKICLFEVNNKNVKAKGVKIIKDNNKDTNINNVLLVSLLLTLNIFTLFSSVSIVDFEQVIICWVKVYSTVTNLQNC